MSKTVVDNTSVQNKLNSGANRSSITFAVDSITIAGQTSGTKCALKNVADPSSASDAVNKSYVDTKVSQLSQGLSWKEPVKARTTANLDGNYATGTLSAKVPGAFPDQDSVPLLQGDRILVAAQANKSENGIYELTASGDQSTPWSLSRPGDADTPEELTGATTTVLLGQEYSSVVYVQKNQVDDMSDDLEWVQTSSAVNSVDATDGLVKQGAYVKLNPDNSTIGIASDRVEVLQDGITSRELAPSSVEASSISSGAVTTEAVSDLAITADKLSGDIPGDKLADNTLTSNLYGPQSVDSAAIKARAVLSQAIGIGQVQRENLANAVVGSDEIEGNSLSGAIHIADGSLITSNYGQNSVDQSALAPASVGATELKSNAVTTSKVLAGNIVNASLSDTVGQEACDTNVMRDGCCTKEKIALAAIEEPKMASASVSNRVLQDGSITSNKLGTLTSLDVAGGISCSDLTVGGSGGSGSSFALCKMVFNHIDIGSDYAFTGSFRRIMDNNVFFSHDDKVVAINATARLVYKSSTGHAGTLGFVLACRWWNDGGTAPETFTEPVAYDQFSVGRGDTHEKEAILQGFGAENAGAGAKYLHSVSWWAREVSGNTLIAPAGNDFISTIQVVNDSSSKQSQTWDGTQLVDN